MIAETFGMKILWGTVGGRRRRELKKKPFRVGEKKFINSGSGPGARVEMSIVHTINVNHSVKKRLRR